MNGLVVCLASLPLGCGGMLACLTPSFAQVEQSLPIAPQSQSELLTTQPLAIERSTTTNRSSFDQERLSNVADSIQANPTKPQLQRHIPDNLLPRDLIRTPGRILNNNHPLEDFLPPAPNQSFGINLNRL
jgi:hypothetical protein